MVVLGVPAVQLHSQTFRALCVQDLSDQEDIRPESVLAVEAVQLIAAEEHASVVDKRTPLRSPYA